MPEQNLFSEKIKSYQNKSCFPSTRTLPQNPLGILDEIIENLKNKLRDYARKPNASQSYIDNQNELIMGLVETYNSIESLQRFDTWILIEAIIKELSAQDNELTSVIIKIPLRDLQNRRDNPCFIDFTKKLLA